MKRIPKKASNKYAAYFELTKPSITFMILISTALGYYLGSDNTIDLKRFFFTLLGSGLVSSGAGALNHFAEMETDRLMTRTSQRPIPTGLITPDHARVFGITFVLIGALLLYVFIDPLTALLALITALLYIFIYTPLKKMTWLNTSIGAIPGSIPPLGGWVAASGTLEPEAWVLFAILFFWQHPHFYAIAWMCKDDYAAADFKMLPVIEPDGTRTMRQIFWHLLLMIPVSLLPVVEGSLGMIYLIGVTIISCGFFISAIPLAKDRSHKSALLLLKASVFYLPALLIIIMIDLGLKT